MEKLFYNLSEEEFTKGRKIILWIVTGLFFFGGIYVAMLSPVFGKHSIKPLLSLAPFGISLIIGTTALYASVQRKDLFFLIDDNMIEFRYGVFRPKKYTFLWSNVKKMVFPHKEKKAKLMFKDGTSYTIDLSYLQRKKSTVIRKYLYHAAREHNIDVLKVITLSHHKTHHESHTA